MRKYRFCFYRRKKNKIHKMHICQQFCINCKTIFFLPTNKLYFKTKQLSTYILNKLTENFDCRPNRKNKQAFSHGMTDKLTRYCGYI